jgi:hypothetical protein
MSMVRRMRYEPALPIGEGLDYILRVGERWPMIVLGECLYSYRIHKASLTNTNAERRLGLVREALRLACSRRGVNFAHHFPHLQGRLPIQDHRERDNGLAAHYMDSVCSLRRVGRWKEALRTGWQCLRLHPTHGHYYKAMAYALVPLWALQYLRRRASTS